jgi:hypothetical protein
MVLEPLVLSSITSAIVLAGQEYAKGLSGEAGKTTWNGIKHLFAWKEDPPVAEISKRVSDGLTGSPELVEKLLELLKQDRVGPVASLVETLIITGGKVVFAQTIHTLNM